jgi:hypothetical protein
MESRISPPVWKRTSLLIIDKARKIRRRRANSTSGKRVDTHTGPHLFICQVTCSRCWLDISALYPPRAPLYHKYTLKLFMCIKICMHKSCVLITIIIEACLALILCMNKKKSRFSHSSCSLELFIDTWPLFTQWHSITTCLLKPPWPARFWLQGCPAPLSKWNCLRCL